MTVSENLLRREFNKLLAAGVPWAKARKQIASRMPYTWDRVRRERAAEAKRLSTTKPN